MANGRLELVCQHCRWRPPRDLQMELVAAHFDMEDGHDPGQIKMELVAWCNRCDIEMVNERSYNTPKGWQRILWRCNGCRRTHYTNRVPE